MITTKTGDKGYTSLLNGRFKKTNPVFHLIGALDEAIALAGELELFDLQDKIKFALDNIALGSDIPKEAIERLEEEINLSLKAFIRPRGKSAKIHVIRAVIRRAERWSWEVYSNNIPVYLNRLSDWVFVYAVKKAEEWNELSYF